MEITLICKIKCNLLYKRYKESLNRYFCLIVFEFLHTLEGFVGLIKDQLYLRIYQDIFDLIPEVSHH